MSGNSSITSIISQQDKIHRIEGKSYSDEEMLRINKNMLQAFPDSLNKNAERIDKNDASFIGERPSLGKPSINTTDINLSKLLNVMNSMQSAPDNDSIRNNINKLIPVYESKLDNYRNATRKYSSLVNSSKQANDKMVHAKKYFDNADKQVRSQLKKRNNLLNQIIVLPEHNPERRELEQKLALTGKHLDLAIEKKKTADKSLGCSVIVQDALLSQTMAVYDELSEQEKNNAFSTNLCLSTEVHENKSNTSQFILLMTSLLEVMGDTSIESLQSQSDVMKEINRAREARMNDMAKTSKKLSHIMKIINYVITASSVLLSVAIVISGVATAIFSGGLTFFAAVSIASGLIGLSLVAIDVFGQLFFDVSPVSWVMQKFFEGTTWLVEHYDLKLKIIDKIMEAVGFNNDQIDMFNDVYAIIEVIIVTLIIAVATFVICKQLVATFTADAAEAASTAAMKTAEQTAEQVVEKTVEKATEETAEKAAEKTVEKIAENVAKGLGKKITLKIIGATVKIHALDIAFFSLCNAVVNVGYQNNIANADIARENIQVEQEVNKGILQIMESLEKAINEMVASLSNILQDRYRALQSSMNTLA